MVKVSRKLIDPKDFGKYVNNLWAAFTLMDSKEDIRLLFKDLFTRTEYKMFTKRLKIARRLIKKESYKTIQKALGVTAHTITTVNNILIEKGEGLRKAHDKLSSLEEKYLRKQQNIQKNFDNPFRKKAQRKTLLGAALKVGVQVTERKILKIIKHKSAGKELLV
jgi:uncharacterized protein YerC